LPIVKKEPLNVLRPQGYGYIVEIRMQADRGFAFVKLDTHENAALAIVQLQNQLVHGRPVKCSWGKDREGGGPTTGTVSSGIISQQPGGAAMPGMMGGVAVPAGYPAMVSLLETKADFHRFGQSKTDLAKPFALVPNFFFPLSYNNKYTACLKPTRTLNTPVTRDTTPTPHKWEWASVEHRVLASQANHRARRTVPAAT
jgi:RNA recognition motif-containing protein